MQHSFTIRSYLLLLVLGILVPLLSLHWYLVYKHAAQDKESAERLIVGLANIAAGDTEHFLFDAKSLLQKIVRQSPISSLNPTRCDNYLKSFPCSNPNFCSISVLTTSGKIVCSEAEPPEKAIDVLAEQNWLQKLMRQNGFVVSEPFRDPNTSRQVIVMGYPVHGERKQIIGAVVVAVDLLDYDSVHYKSALANAHLPPGSVVTIVDSADKVIARWPDAQAWVGTKAGDAEIVRRMHAMHPGQTIQAHGMDGIEKLYGIVDIANTDWHLYVGIPTAFFVAPSLALKNRNMFLGAAIALFAIALATYLSGLIRNPIRRLSQAVAAAASGSRSVCLPLHGPREIVEVGQRFNDMIAARFKAEDALAEEKERAEVTLASIGDAVITTDAAGKVIYLNPVAEQLTGWRNAQTHGAPLWEVVNLVDSVSRAPFHKTLEQAIQDGFLVTVADNTVLVRRDGKEFGVADCAAPIRDRNGMLTGMVLVFRDISKAQELSRRLSWQATHDALTGLFSRAEFEKRLELALASAKQDDLQHALLYLDLDQFKIINDTCGHGAGDVLLRQLTSILQNKVRDNDTLARLGGDEFGVLVENCPLDQALRIAEEFREVLQDFRFAWEGKAFTIGVSIGVVPINAYSESLANVMSAADAACYTAKEKGRNRVHVFQPDDLDLEKRLGEMQWVQRISHAFEENLFRLYCQPIVSIEAGPPRIVRHELLIRMLNEAGEVLLPEAFLPAAERYNLMPTIDRWVVRTLFKQLSVHRALFDGGEIFFVNISGPALGEELFLDFVLDQFNQTQVPPTQICFEITETAAIINLSQATRFISELKNRGCIFALDDFGSGLSSFAYLKNLQVDFLKIAGYFVQDILSDPIDHAMVESINHIGHVMQLKTIAESVENDAIFAKLKAMGVDYAQGFSIAYPIPLEAYLAR